MKLLVVGNGGREHAIAWKLIQSNAVQMVYVATGNGGTSLDKRLQTIAITEIDELVAFCKTNQITYTVVGPEVPLANGIVDTFQKAGLAIFGPTKLAAELESSKAFSKNFMQKYGIPTAIFAIFEEKTQAETYLQTHSLPVVIKADGLAAGKGVFIAQNLQEAQEALENIFTMPYGAKVIIEEFIDGEEASFIVMSDGKNVLPLASSQDHKRLLSGDKGPNTGGMGAYSPAPIVTPTIHAKIMREVIEPTLKGMAQEGRDFTGFLYAGIMVDKQGAVKVLEFNCRMGDPETQVIMPRLKSDLAEVFKLAVQQKLNTIELEWDRRHALGVVMAAKDYPYQSCKHLPISGLEKMPVDTDVPEPNLVFHAGTYVQDDIVYANGGRILCVVSMADSLRACQKYALEMVQKINFEGAQYRDDIGHRALNKSNET